MKCFLFELLASNSIDFIQMYGFRCVNTCLHVESSLLMALILRLHVTKYVLSKAIYSIESDWNLSVYVLETHLNDLIYTIFRRFLFAHLNLLNYSKQTCIFELNWTLCLSILITELLLKRRENRTQETYKHEWTFVCENKLDFNLLLFHF